MISNISADTTTDIKEGSSNDLITTEEPKTKQQGKQSYNLLEIADWAITNYISLPTVQRGFVWRPAQIESLWDSLLRGYPIGAFVLSSRGQDGYEILDGQQRATAICLGFAQKTFRNSDKHIRVFIDLAKPNGDDNRKYIFRVITSSHPWGYQRNEPTETLSTYNIRKAMDRYNIVNDINIDLDKYFPYDAGFPLPFYYFLSAAATNKTMEQLFLDLSQWRHWPDVFRNWAEVQDQDQDTVALIKVDIARIYLAVLKMLCAKTGQSIPAVYMNLDQFVDEDLSDKVEAADEIETLFIRLNAGGTQLVGEELNYSILKAHLSRDIQDTIEEACKTLFRPARFITIAFRLFQITLGGEYSDGLSMRVRPKQFQKSISKNISEFGQFLIKLTTQSSIDGKTLLTYTKDVLSYSSSQPYGLPFLIYSKISDNAPEVMFLLLYRIWFHNDRFTSNSMEGEAMHRKALGMLTLFTWFGRGENLRDHSHLLNHVWPIANIASHDEFWANDTIQRASINGALIPFPNFQDTNNILGLERFLTYSLSENSNLLNRFDKDGGAIYNLFVRKVIWNRDLIVYAQRAFLEQYFRKEQYRMEDTNVPFDWDHISPHKFVYSKKNVPQVVKDWYNTIGNFRAWPYALNRMDSDKCPAHKLKPLSKKNNTIDPIEKEKWLRFIDQNKALIDTPDDLEKKLLSWSFCHQSWSSCESEDMKNNWQKTIRAIVHRNISLIEEWYQQCRIEDLKPPSFRFDQILLKSRWKKVPIQNANIDKWFNHDHRISWISNSFSILDHEIRFYFYYPHGELNFLEERKMGFGILHESGEGFIKKMMGKTDSEIDTDTYEWIEKKHTVLSCSKASIEKFLYEIKDWMMKLPMPNKAKQELFETLSDFLTKRWKAV